MLAPIAQPRTSDASSTLPKETSLCSARFRLPRTSELIVTRRDEKSRPFGLLFSPRKQSMDYCGLLPDDGVAAGADCEFSGCAVPVVVGVVSCAGAGVALEEGALLPADPLPS